MMWGETKRLPVRRFGLNKAALPLVKTSLFQPPVDGGRVALACRFLTASLGSIHDASAGGQERN